MIISSWKGLMAQFKLHPRATASQMLSHLEDQPSPSRSDEKCILDAVKNCGVPNAVDLILVQLSKGVVRKLLTEL
jgi:hypothetical protein